MLDQFLQGLSNKLASVWRIFGSPRIAGSAKAASFSKTAWSKKGQVSPRTPSLPARTRNAIIGFGGVAVAILSIWLVMSLFSGDGDEVITAEGFPTPTPFAGPEFMTEVQALSLALAAARDAGLVSQNFDHIGRRIRFGEYAVATGERNRADLGLLETPSETEIWAFAFAGDVRLELDNGEKVDYDNLTVVVDALTGNIYRVEAFYGDYESEARAPVWLRPPEPTATPRPAPTN